MAWCYERIFLTWAYTVEMTVPKFVLRKMTRISGQNFRTFVVESPTSGYVQNLLYFVLSSRPR